MLIAAGSTEVGRRGMGSFVAESWDVDGLVCVDGQKDCGAVGSDDVGGFDVGEHEGVAQLGFVVLDGLEGSDVFREKGFVAGGF